MAIVRDSSLLRVSVVALSTAGAISVPGLKVGDAVIWGFDTDHSAWYGPGGFFEASISVADQLQQLQSGVGGVHFDFVLVRLS